jgi:choline dehydrogenase-like flavoprotein
MKSGFRRRIVTMNTGERYDFVIIGKGAGGGVLAWKLAPSGKRILAA